MQKLPTEVKLQRVSSLRNSFYSCPTELLQSCGKVIRPATPLTKELCGKLSGNCLKIFKPTLFKIPLVATLVSMFLFQSFLFFLSHAVSCVFICFEKIFALSTHGQYSFCGFFCISVEKKNLWSVITSK